MAKTRTRGELVMGEKNKEASNEPKKTSDEALNIDTARDIT